MSTLKMEYEISNNLNALYDFMYRHLIQANFKKDAKMITEVIDLLEDLRNAWAEALKVTRGQAVGMNG